MLKINTFTVIGLGKVGKIFTHILKKDLKFKLDYIIDTKQKGDFLGCKILENIPKKIDSDLIVISTPDDAIWNTINLLNSKYIIKKDTIFLHFSGATYIPINNIISIHPMMSITDYKTDIKRLNNHYFSLQSNNKDLISLFVPIIKQISNNYIIITGEQKKYFHLASVMINNFSTALIKSSIEVIKKLNINENDALKIMLPLFEDVFINLKNNQNINNSLTGPIVRRDKKTIDKHLNLLKTEGLNDENIIYNTFLHYINKNFLQ